MFSSERKLMLTRKIMCILMSVLLVLLMVPSMLITSVAHAVSQTTTGESQASVSTFGNFIFNANSAEVNQSKYSEAQILEKLGMKAESTSTVQKNAEEQIKLALVKQLHSITTENMPAPEEGAAATVTSINTITSSQPFLSAAKVPGTTDWQFTTSDPKSSNAVTELSISAKYATWKASYKCVLNGNPVQAKTEIPVNADAAMGKIVLTPTGTVDAKNAPITMVMADLQLKSLASNLNKYNATVTNVTPDDSAVPTDKEAEKKGTENTDATSVKGKNGPVFVDESPQVSLTYGAKKTYEKEDLFKEGEPTKEYEYSTEVKNNSTKETAPVCTASFASTTNALTIKAVKTSKDGAKVTLTAKEIDEETGELKEVDSLVVNVTSVAPQTVSFDVKSNVNEGNDLPARLSADQKKYVFNQLNGKTVDQSAELTLSVTKDILWNDKDYSVGNDITVNTKSLKLLKGGETTDDYQLDVGDTNILTISPIQDAEYGTEYVFKDSGSEVKKSDLTTHWFSNAGNALIAGKENCKVSKSLSGFSDTCSLIEQGAKPSDALEINGYVQDADKVVKKFEQSIKYDNTVPTYYKYVIDREGQEEGKTFFEGILDNLKKQLNFFFSSESVKVKFYFQKGTNVCGLSSLELKGTGSNEMEISDSPTIVTEDNVEYYVFTGKLNDEQDSVDMRDWTYKVQTIAGLTGEGKVVTDENNEDVKIISKASGPGQCTAKWYEDSKARVDNPTGYLAKDQTLKLVLTDKYYQYAQSYYTSEAGSDGNAQYIAITKTVYDGSTAKPESKTEYKRLSDFKQTTEDGVWEMNIPCDTASDTVTHYSVKKLCRYHDPLGREAEKELLDKPWSFYVVKMDLEVESVEWTPKTPETGKYYNYTHTATINVKSLIPIEDMNAKNYVEVDAYVKDKKILSRSDWKELEKADAFYYSCTVEYGDSQESPSNIYEGKCCLEISGKGLIGSLNYSKDAIQYQKDKNFYFTQDWTSPELKVNLSADWSPMPSEANHYNGVDYFKVGSRTLTTNFTEEYSWSDEGTGSCSGIKVEKVDGWSDDYPYSFDGSWYQSDPYGHNGKVIINGEGHFQFKISGTDLAGNPLKVFVDSVEQDGNSFDSGKFALDTTSPAVTVEWNRYDAKNGHYYNGPRTAYITIKERNFEPSQDYVQFNYKRVDDYGRVYETNLNSGQWKNEPGDIHKTSVTFGDEGDIDFNITGTDLAKNNVDNNSTTFFTQDWTNPTMNVTWDNNAEVNGKYYTAARTATFTIEEHNFSPGLIQVTPIVTPGHDGTMGTAIVSGWSSNNNTHTASVSFPSQGTYSMTVEGMDLATNALSPYAQKEFIIDWTQPQIQISGVENMQAYKEVAQPVVTINDANMSSATNCQVSGLGITPGNPYNTSPSASDAVYVYSYSNPEKVPDNDGVYRIEVNAVDMAGNTSTQSLVWSLNRFGSTYVVDKETESMLNGYVNNKTKKDVKVTEINPSEVTSSTVEVTKGSFTSGLEEGKDYTTNSSGGGDSWFQREYTISKDYFKEDSNYTVNFLSKDAAGNESANTMDNKNSERNSKVNVKFMLDNAKPNYTFNGLSEAQYGELSHNASVKFEDNSKKFSDAVVKIDGQKQEISGSQLENDNYIVDFTLEEANTPHTIEVSATDKAGNTMDTAYKTVVVSTNPFVRWFYNTPLFVGTLVCVVLIAGAITGFVLYRRKKNLV